MRIIIFILILSTSILLWGCQTANNIITTTPTDILSVVPSPTVMQTTTAVIPATLKLAPSPTMTQTSTPDVPVNIMERHCIVEKDIPDLEDTNISLTGVIVWVNKSGDVYSYDYRDGQSYSFQKNIRLSGIEVSPDRTRILFGDYSSNGSRKVILASPYGEELWSSEVDNSTIMDWFDDQRLVVDSNYSQLYLLNLDTGKKQELVEADLPGILQGYDLEYLYWEYPAIAKYNLPLTRVVYPKCDADCLHRNMIGDTYFPVAMMDVKNNKIITELITLDMFGMTPIWNKIGDHFIFAATLSSTSNPDYDGSKELDEFYLIHDDGQIEKLTQFGEYFKQVSIGDRYLTEYFMSPNERYIAFWMQTNNSNSSLIRLVVLDIVSRNVVDYCVPIAERRTQVIWSPDSKYLLIGSNASDPYSLENVLLIDVEKKSGVIIAHDQIPVAWMVSVQK